jgi:TrpR-related protein YerC/YecD
MKKEELQEKFSEILKVLSFLQDEADTFDFLRDLLSEKEILEFSRRFEVAKMLQNKVSYTDIEKKTGMSSTTIARIWKFLNWENQGYQKALSCLKSITYRHQEGNHF